MANYNLPNSSRLYLNIMSFNPRTTVQTSLITLALSALTMGHAVADPKVMVAGDSISAGFEEPSYRLPLLDALDDYGCPVDMVGDQTLNNFSFRNPTTSPGNEESPFTVANGYDTDHQSFPGIRADEFLNGYDRGSYTVNPAEDYVGAEQPDFILLHLGTNDLGNQRRVNRFTTDEEINDWADTTLDEIVSIIEDSFGAHNNPSDLKILVANFIPYQRRNSDWTAAELVRAARASKLFTQRLESMILDQADERILIVDVETGFDPISMTNDGIHPNSAGEQHIAGAFLPVLRGAGLCPSTPEITSPAVGSSVVGESALLQWSANGANVNRWRVRVGDNQSGNSSAFYDSGNLSGGTTSVSLTGLPANLTNVIVSLEYRIGTVSDMVFSSFLSRSSDPDNAVHIMNSPLSGASLPGSEVNFSWESNDRDYSDWYVRIGTTPDVNDPDRARYMDRRIVDESARSVSVSGLPTDGRTIYMQLSGKTRSGPWVDQFFSFTAAGGGLPDKVLEPTQWYQISLPYDPGSGNRVRDVFGDALPVANYASSGSNGTWVVFDYVLNGSSQLSDGYVRMDLDDRMDVGKGYWVQHVESGAVTLSAPSGASANSSNVTSAQQAACENPGRCYAVPIDAEVTNGQAGRFTMLGYPLANPTDAPRIRVNTSNNIGCSGTRDCTLAEAFTNDLLFEILYSWRPDAGAQGEYEFIGPLTGVLNPWDGFWAAQITAAEAQNAALVMSEPAAQ